MPVLLPPAAEAVGARTSDAVVVVKMKIQGDTRSFLRLEPVTGVTPSTHRQIALKSMRFILKVIQFVFDRGANHTVVAWKVIHEMVV